VDIFGLNSGNVQLRLSDLSLQNSNFPTVVCDHYVGKVAESAIFVRQVTGTTVGHSFSLQKLQEKNKIVDIFETR